MHPIIVAALLVVLVALPSPSRASSILERRNYVGLLPSILFEPYDKVDAIEVNVAPFVYEYRFTKQSALQIRPLVNYRFSDTEGGVSHLGATVVFNRYFPGLFWDDPDIIPVLGSFVTYTWNNLDRMNTMTVGLEPGVVFAFTDALSLTVVLQPGVNYYPDRFSRDFVGASGGFLPHFGVVVHAGLNL